MLVLGEGGKRVCSDTAKKEVSNETFVLWRKAASWVHIYRDDGKFLAPVATRQQIAWQLVNRNVCTHLEVENYTEQFHET